MAGAGYKLFNTGDVLTAAQVNTYLMEQTVMVFADAAARTTALSGVVSEGMISYLKDTNAVEVYNGSAWVASDDPNAIKNTIVDAKGDLISASAADVPARLAVGADGSFLMAASGETTGLRYNPQNALANPVINGGMDIWQRGTAAVTTANVYTADRWQKDGQTTSSVSRQTTSDTTNLPNIQYCVRVARTNGDSGTFARGVYQALETATSFPFIGKTITVSYYARKGSSFSGSLTFRFMTGTGTDEACNFGVNMTGQVNTDTAITSSLTTGWQRFATTFTVPTTATQIALGFRHAPSGTASDTNDYFELTGVQIDLGTYTASTAPTFRRSGGTLQGELAACQRYYYRAAANAAGEMFGSGFIISSTLTDVLTFFPVPMRIAPTALEQSGTAGDYSVKWSGSGGTACTAVPVIGNVSRFSARTVFETGATLTTGQGALGRAVNSSAYLAWSAEL